MTEGLPLYSPAPPTQRQPPDPDPDPVETELGAAGARTETSLATRGIIRARLSCPKNYSEGNRNSSESQSRDPGDPPQSSPPPLPGRTPTHKAGNLATPPQKQAEPAPRGRGAVGSGRVGWGGHLDWGGRRGLAQTVTCRRAWSSCGAEDRFSASILVSSLQSSVSSN